MNEKISVIIPLYNKEREIKRTLDSVLSQTFQNFEIIIVDDHSSDGGPAIVKSNPDPRITLIEQDHRGVSYTRNHGVNLATSDFIAFIDADDEWKPTHLETIMRLIKKYPEAGMFSTAWKIRTSKGETRWANLNWIPKPTWEGLLPDYFKSGDLGDSPVCTSVVAMPKKIFFEMGGFADYWKGQDLDLWGKIALKYPVAFSWEGGAIYHHDASNRTCDKKVPLDYQEPFIKTARAALMKGEVPQELIKSLNDYIWRKEYVRAIRNVNAGQSVAAQIILKQCITKGHYIESMKWLFLAKIPYPIFLFLKEIKRNLNKRVQKNALNAEK
jgi:glycosyltransferase involved in cell wall biosynthesis